MTPYRDLACLPLIRHPADPATMERRIEHLYREVGSLEEGHRKLNARRAEGWHRFLYQEHTNLPQKPPLRDIEAAEAFVRCQDAGRVRSRAHSARYEIVASDSLVRERSGSRGTQQCNRWKLKNAFKRFHKSVDRRLNGLGDGDLDFPPILLVGKADRVRFAARLYVDLLRHQPFSFSNQRIASLSLYSAYQRLRLPIRAIPLEQDLDFQRGLDRELEARRAGEGLDYLVQVLLDRIEQVEKLEQSAAALQP